MSVFKLTHTFIHAIQRSHSIISNRQPCSIFPSTQHETTFIRLFCLTHLDTTTVLSSTTKKDALHAFSKKVVIVDLSMSTNMARAVYNCLENLKTHTSAKFDGHIPMGNPPAVMLILSNNEPRLLQAPSLKMLEYSSRKGATFDHVNL